MTLETKVAFNVGLLFTCSRHIGKSNESVYESTSWFRCHGNASLLPYRSGKSSVSVQLVYVQSK